MQRINGKSTGGRSTPQADPHSLARELTQTKRVETVEPGPPENRPVGGCPQPGSSGASWDSLRRADFGDFPEPGIGCVQRGATAWTHSVAKRSARALIAAPRPNQTE